MASSNFDHLPYKERLDHINKIQSDLIEKKREIIKLLHEQKTPREKGKITKFSSSIIILLMVEIVIMVTMYSVAPIISLSLIYIIIIIGFTLMSMIFILMLSLIRYETSLKPLLIKRFNNLITN